MSAFRRAADGEDLWPAAQALRAFHRDEDSIEADVGSLLVASFMRAVVKR